MVKTASLEDDVHAKIMRGCPKTSTVSAYIDSILSESEYLPQLKESAAKMHDCIEAYKKNPSLSIGHTPDAFLRLDDAFIVDVEARSRDVEET